MPKTLNATNPESLIYEHELLKLTVLGGIKLEGLDRMRATLKIELKKSSVPPVRHNLDLYNDNQTEKLIRRTAEKLEIGTSVIAASLAELTSQLEEYRMQQIKQAMPADNKGKVLSSEERKEAENFLKAPRLLERTNELIGKSGMIGEASNRLLMYLIFTSRKQNQPLHIVSLGASGTGKTHLQEKVGELIPEEDRIEITTLSENAFYYFGQRELKNKLILIEDLDGADHALYPLRELQSKKRISKTVAHKNTKGETRTLHLVVEGPVSVAGCTTREQIYEDNANRSFLIYLDESEEQDQRVMEYQRAASAGKIDKQQEEKAASLLRNCQRLLEPIKVVNPYAELLKIPKEVFKPRRTNNHYLQFIEVVTFYHQFQREKKVNQETEETVYRNHPGRHRSCESADEGGFA
jgi:uridine kinase